METVGLDELERDGDDKQFLQLNSKLVGAAKEDRDRRRK